MLTDYFRHHCGKPDVKVAYFGSERNPADIIYAHEFSQDQTNKNSKPRWDIFSIIDDFESENFFCSEAKRLSAHTYTSIE